MKVLRLLLVFLLVISLFLAVSCKTDDGNDISYRKDFIDSEELKNENILDSRWETDPSLNFSYISYKPGGAIVPLVAKGISYPDEYFTYMREVDGERSFGLMDRDFNKVTDFISEMPIIGYEGILRIVNDDKYQFLDSDFSLLHEYYPGYLFIDGTIIEIGITQYLNEFSYMVPDIDMETYLVPARIYTGDDEDSDYLVGYTPFKNVSTGSGPKENDFIIAPQFDEAKLFHDGLAAVKKDGLWGYIDESGDLVIDYQFKEANSFGYGRAGVYDEYIPGKSGKDILNLFWNIIDESGNMVGDYKYDWIGAFANGAAIVRITEKNQELIMTFIDPDGKDFLGSIPSIQYLYHFSGEYQAIYTGTNWYYINNNYKKVFGRDFAGAKNFKEGYGTVKIEWNGEWGFINASGELVIEDKYLYAGSFSSGYAYVFDKESKSGYLIDIHENKYLEELNLAGISTFNEEGYALGYAKDESTADQNDYIYYMIHIDN